MKRNIFIIFIILFSQPLLANKKCVSFWDREPPRSFLNQEGMNELNAIINRLQNSSNATAEEIYTYYRQLLPLIFRSGLTWQEILAISTPEGSEVYVSRIPTANLAHSLLSFLDANLGNPQKLTLKNIPSTQEFLIQFLINFRNYFDPNSYGEIKP